MTRITMKQLQAQVDALNSYTGNPTVIWRKETHNGPHIAHVGAYVLNAAYGGYRLCQIVGESGGERDLTPRVSAGECSRLISAYIMGRKCGENTPA